MSLPHKITTKVNSSSSPKPGLGRNIIARFDASESPRIEAAHRIYRASVGASD